MKNTKRWIRLQPKPGPMKTCSSPPTLDVTKGQTSGRYGAQNKWLLMLGILCARNNKQVYVDSLGKGHTHLISIRCAASAGSRISANHNRFDSKSLGTRTSSCRPSLFCSTLITALQSELPGTWLYERAK